MSDGAALPPVTVPDAPPPEIVFRRRLHFFRAMKELWASRELIATLNERTLRSRYKQTFLGFGWALITPVMLMVVFTVFLRQVVSIKTYGIPYPVFSYVGLLPWSFFSGAMSNSSSVILSNNSLLNKIYCPREVFPISTIVSAAFDTAFAMIALVVLFVVSGYAPTAGVVWVPPLTVVLVLFTLGVCLVFSAATVYLRDLRYGVSIILQLGLFATPVAYSLSEVVPRHWRLAYSVINPLAPLVQAYRDTVLLGRHPNVRLCGAATLASIVWAVVGYIAFKRMETGFGDVA